VGILITTAAFLYTFLHYDVVMKYDSHYTGFKEEDGEVQGAGFNRCMEMVFINWLVM